MGPWSKFVIARLGHDRHSMRCWPCAGNLLAFRRSLLWLSMLRFSGTNLTWLRTMLMIIVDMPISLNSLIVSLKVEAFRKLKESGLTWYCCKFSRCNYQDIVLTVCHRQNDMLSYCKEEVSRPLTNQDKTPCLRIPRRKA